MRTGACYCKAIRYAVPDSVSHSTNCHCEMCRGTTGAPFVAWFTVPADQFVLVSGAPASFRSSSHGTRTFCPACGTQISFADDATPGDIDITTCSLDDPNSVPPHSHIFTQSKVSWLILADGLPQYRRSRSEG